MHPNVLGRKIRGEVSLSAGELGGIAGALGTTGAEIMRRAEAATSPVLAVSSGGVPSPQEVLDHEVACVCRRSCTLGRGSRPTAATAGLQAWV